MKRRSLFRPLLALAALAVALPAAAQNLVKLKAGMVTGIDQVGLPSAASSRSTASTSPSPGRMPPASTRSTRCRPARARSCRWACR